MKFVIELSSDQIEKLEEMTGGIIDTNEDLEAAISEITNNIN